MKYEEKTDKYTHTTYMSFSPSTPVSKLRDFLYSNFQGYGFLIPIDCFQDEWEKMEEIPVYFRQDLLKELCYEAGVESIARILTEMGGCKCETCEAFTCGICDNLKTEVQKDFYCKYYQRKEKKND